MARLDILEHPDPRLRTPASAVTTFDASLERLVADLIETLAAVDAIGLSATQVDDHRRVLVIEPSGGDAIPRVYVNPEITAMAAWGLVEESCLSIPGTVGNVVRATRIAIRAQDGAGRAFEHRLEGMDAVCLQHEVDHLDGRLFVDRFSMLERLRLRFFAKARAG